MRLADLRIEFEQRLAAVLAAARAARAHPSELRVSLVALEQAARLQLAGESVEDDEDWAFVHRRLDSFVRDELAAYIKVMAPPPAIGAIFGQAAERQRAAASATEPNGGRAAGAAMMKCQRCGAPRQRESEYGNCGFCGAPFFPGSSGSGGSDDR